MHDHAVVERIFCQRIGGKKIESVEFRMKMGHLHAVLRYDAAKLRCDEFRMFCDLFHVAELVADIEGDPIGNFAKSFKAGRDFVACAALANVKALNTNASTTLTR